MNLNKSKLFNEYFPNKDKNLTKEQLKEKCLKIVEMLDNDKQDNDLKVALLSDAELEQLEMSSLELYLQVCSAMEDKIFEQKYPVVELPIGDSFPCDVHYNQELGALLIDTPVQLGSYRTYGEVAQQHLIAVMVNLAIKGYEQEHNFNFFDTVKSPFCIYLVRRCKRGANSNSIPDIDNVGARHVINILVRELGLSDSFSSLTWNCNTVEYVQEGADQGGTSLLIVSEDKKLEFESKFLQNSHSMIWLRY